MTRCGPREVRCLAGGVLALVLVLCGLIRPAVAVEDQGDPLLTCPSGTTMRTLFDLAGPDGDAMAATGDWVRDGSGWRIAFDQPSFGRLAAAAEIAVPPGQHSYLYLRAEYDFARDTRPSDLPGRVVDVGRGSVLPGFVPHYWDWRDVPGGPSESGGRWNNDFVGASVGPQVTRLDLRSAPSQISLSFEAQSVYDAGRPQFWRIDSAVVFTCDKGSLVGLAMPSLVGEARVGEPLSVTPGSWTGAVRSWVTPYLLRDGQVLRAGSAGVPTPSYVVQPNDVGHTFGAEDFAVSSDTWIADHQRRRSPTAVVAVPGRLEPFTARLSGRARVGRTLRPGPSRGPQTSRNGEVFRYAWLRDGRPIPGATGYRYRIGKKDRGHRISVRITAQAPGYTPTFATSRATPRVQR